MRIAERPAAQQPPVGELPGDRMDHADLQRLGRISGGRMPGRRAASIDLPAPGGPIISRLWPPAAATSSARLAALLALDVARDRGSAPAASASFGCGGVSTWRALEVVDQREQVRRRQHLDPPGPGRLAALRGRADQPAVLARRMDRRRQHAGHRRDRAVEAEFAQRRVVVPAHRPAARPWRPAGRARSAGRNGCLPWRRSAGARLTDDALRRQRQADGGERAAHPLAALAHRLVRQADQHEIDQAAGHAHLGIHLPHIDALEGHGLDAGGHIRV